MNRLIKSTATIIGLPLLSCNSPAQEVKLAYKDLQSIRIEHTNPSLGNNEIIKAINLECNKTNLKEISKLLKNIEVNNSISLLKYLNASKANNSKLIDQVLNNAPKKSFNEGGTTSNLLFIFKDKAVVKLQDIYRQFNLTNFNPEFTTFLVNHGQLTTNNSNLNLKNMNTNNYKDTDAVIKLQLTPGSPGSNSYYLTIYGNGSYTSLYGEGGTITKTAVQQILKKARDIDFNRTVDKSLPLVFVHDGQQTNVSIWSDNTLIKGEFGAGHPMPETVQSLVELILEKTNTRNIGLHDTPPNDYFLDQVKYSDTDVIIKITKSPGGPNSRHTNLSILGDGTCETDIYDIEDQKRALSKEEVKEVFDRVQKAGIFEEERIELTEPKKETQFIHDGASTSINFKYNGKSKTEMSGHGRSMKPGTMEIINYIFHSLEFDYKPSDIILQVELTPGDPDSDHYRLSIFGDGKYRYSSSRESEIRLKETEGYIAKDDIIRIFNAANQDELSSSSLRELYRDQNSNSSDAQQTNISIWRNHELKKEIFEEKTATLPAVKDFIDFIFHTIEKK